MEQKTICQQCGTGILATTAQKTGGICMSCYKHRPGMRWRNTFWTAIALGITLIVTLLFSPYLIVKYLIVYAPDILFPKRRKACQVACEAFQHAFPHEDQGGRAHVKYREPLRYIIEMCYGNTRPPQVVFWAVEKDTYHVYQVTDPKYYPTYTR